MSGYSNVLVKGATREALLDYLNRHYFSSYVSPSANGMTVVYPVEQMLDWLADITRELNCTAFSVLEFDGDIWLYWLYHAGKLVDEYNSRPGYGQGDDVPPSGGNAALLCMLFGNTSSERQIEEVLRHRNKDDDPNVPYRDSVGCHIELAKLLGFPDYAVGVSMSYIDHDRQPGGLDRSAFITAGSR